MPSATILDLAVCSAANRFTLRDRMELGRFAQVAEARGDERLVLHQRLDGDPSDVGNNVAVYAAGCCWASWGLSRRLGGIVVWDSVTGLDSGRFASMHEALTWVLDQGTAAQSEPPGTRRPDGDATRRSRPGPVRHPSWTAPGLVEGVGFEPT